MSAARVGLRRLTLWTGTAAAGPSHPSCRNPAYAEMTSANQN
jgi:hypothetical protein